MLDIAYEIMTYIVRNSLFQLLLLLIPTPPTLYRGED